VLNMRFAIGITLALLSMPPEAQGQTIRISGEKEACLSCLELVHWGSFGDQEGPGFLEITQLVARDARGQTWIGGSDALKLFPGDGRPVIEIGHRGEGPGEFRSITAISIGPRGEVMVFDRGNQRATT